MCTALFDTLRLQFNVTASRFYVNASDSTNVKHYLDEIKSIARGRLLPERLQMCRSGLLISLPFDGEPSHQAEETCDSIICEEVPGVTRTSIDPT